MHRVNYEEEDDEKKSEDEKKKNLYGFPRNDQLFDPSWRTSRDRRIVPSERLDESL